MSNLRFDLTILVGELAEFNQQKAEQEFMRWLISKETSKEKNNIVDTKLDNELTQ